MVEIGSIQNKRPESKGGQSFALLGTVRGGFGNPFDLDAEKGKELDVSLHEVTTRALESVGYTVENHSDQSNHRRIDINVLYFWCDGYVGYKVSSSILIKVIDTKTGDSVLEKRINVDKGFAIIMGYGQMHTAFHDVMNQITTEMVAYMSSDEFRAAV